MDEHDETVTSLRRTIQSTLYGALPVSLSAHSELEFSHSLCPDCAQKLYPELGSVI